MNDQIPHNVAKLGAPFHRVYTAEGAQAYKPRMQAFEDMFDQLGCGPEVMMHVSSSFRYDQNTATDLGFGCRVFVARGHEPSNANYRDIEIPHIGVFASGCWLVKEQSPHFSRRGVIGAGLAGAGLLALGGFSGQESPSMPKRGLAESGHALGLDFRHA